MFKLWEITSHAKRYLGKCSNWVVKSHYHALESFDFAAITVLSIYLPVFVASVSNLFVHDPHFPLSVIFCKSEISFPWIRLYSTEDSIFVWTDFASLLLIDLLFPRPPLHSLIQPSIVILGRGQDEASFLHVSKRIDGLVFVWSVCNSQAALHSAARQPKRTHPVSTALHRADLASSILLCKCQNLFQQYFVSNNHYWYIH